MFNWFLKLLARGLRPHLKEFFTDMVKDSIKTLDADKHYLLFLPACGDVELDEINEKLAPFAGKVKMVVVTTDEFRLLEFKAQEKKKQV